MADNLDTWVFYRAPKRRHTIPSRRHFSARSSAPSPLEPPSTPDNFYSDSSPTTAASSSFPLHSPSYFVETGTACCKRSYPANEPASGDSQTHCFTKTIHQKCQECGRNFDGESIHGALANEQNSLCVDRRHPKRMRKDATHALATMSRPCSSKSGVRLVELCLTDGSKSEESSEDESSATLIPRSPSETVEYPPLRKKRRLMSLPAPLSRLDNHFPSSEQASRAQLLLDFNSITPFRIFRLIHSTDKTGTLILPPTNFTLNTAGVRLAYGQFLLDLSPNRTESNPLVRTISGHEGRVSKRVLQRIDLPWGIPPQVGVGVDGIQLRMATVTSDVEGEANMTGFQRGELVLVHDAGCANGNVLRVRDFEGMTGLVPRECLDFGYLKPWCSLTKGESCQRISRVSKIKRRQRRTEQHDERLNLANGRVQKRPWEL